MNKQEMITWLEDAIRNRLDVFFSTVSVNRDILENISSLLIDKTKKVEYAFKPFDSKSIIESLNKLGEEGWIIINSTFDPVSSSGLFYRVVE